jgi:hypothetical protein
MQALSDVFRNRIISSGISPARLPNLNPCDFSFWGCLKGKIYNSNPRTEEELKENFVGKLQNSCRTASKGKSELLPPVPGMSTCRGAAFSTHPVNCEL